MSLCKACSDLPFEQIFKYMNGDELVQWPGRTHRKTQVLAGSTYNTLYHAWHASIQKWLREAKHCPCCCVFLLFCEDNYYYKEAMAQRKDLQQVWIMIPGLGSREAPELRIFVDVEGPDDKISGQIRFSTTPDSIFARYFEGFTPIADPLHPLVLGKIESWLKSCDEQHIECQNIPGLRATIPTRLIDLDSLPERFQFVGEVTKWRKSFERGCCRLVKSNSEMREPYFALSYCWGKSLPLTTNKANLEKHMQDGGIQFSEIPRTLQDAFFLVRYLGYRYIWVDCLCIVQDDKTDWQREAARMGDVYSSAYLTIAATRASHSDEGFLQLRERKDRFPATFPSIHGPFTLYFEHKDDLSPGSMESLAENFPLKMQREQPLLDRGWCFQERVLARRTVHFASTEMYRECEKMFTIEDDYKYENCREYSIQSIAHSLTLDSGRMSFFAWSELVQEYTSRNLSFESDRLPALSGIINLLQKITGDVCYAGLWRKWFLRGLAWRLQQPKWDKYVAVPKTPRRNTKWTGPLWSFAAVEGVVLYDISSHGECAELEECSVVPLESSFARIKAPLTTIFDIECENTKSGRPCKIRTRSQVLQGNVYLDFEYRASCEAIMIAPCTGLAIIRTGDKQATYIRLGVVDVTGGMFSLGPKLLDWPTPSTIIVV